MDAGGNACRLDVDFDRCSPHNDTGKGLLRHLFIDQLR
jgi:hypothetical protein